MNASARSSAGMLAAAAVGVYLLVIAGATAAVADAAAACGTWPACEVGGEPALLVAWGHRLAAVAVGALVAAAAAATWRRGSPLRVRAAAGAAAGLYPGQVGLGALVVLRGAPARLAGAHLAAGLAIFGAVVLALAWQLEAETAGADAAEGAVPAAGGDSVRSPAPDLAEGDAPAPGADADPTSELPSDPGAGPSSEPAPGAPSADADTGAAAGPAATLVAYLRLTKPKLWWLLCLVALAAMALAAGPALAARTVALTLGGGVLAIGAAGTFNNVLERDRDRRMARTADRPLAAEVVPARNAVAFGVALTAAAVGVLLGVNALAAGLGLAAILFYSVVYTLVLKPHTVQNTVLGGAAGALPALIGWAAVTGRVGVPAVALAAVVFLWTPAHFYNLALAYREDYARGGFPMLPVVRGPAVARKHVLGYLAATLSAAAALAWLAPLGPLYAAAAVGAGAAFLWAVLRLHRERTRGAAMRAFHASNAYLGALLGAVVIDALLL